MNVMKLRTWEDVWKIKKSNILLINFSFKSRFGTEALPKNCSKFAQIWEKISSEVLQASD